jgi:hypothetical protein
MTDIPAFDRVTVFGGITVDRIARTDAAAALGVSNPGTVRSSPGGVGFNMATSLARLGLRTRLVAIVGADADGESVLAAAKAAGVNVDRIVISRGKPTATCRDRRRRRAVIGVPTCRSTQLDRRRCIMRRPNRRFLGGRRQSDAADRLLITANAARWPLAGSRRRRRRRAPAFHDRSNGHNGRKPPQLG